MTYKDESSLDVRTVFRRRRQILTYKDGSQTERIIKIIMAVDIYDDFKL